MSPFPVDDFCILDITFCIGYFSDTEYLVMIEGNGSKCNALLAGSPQVLVLLDETQREISCS